RFVRLPTSRPRYSARTIACAFATSADTSATTACFSVRLRPKVLLLCCCYTSPPRGGEVTRRPSFRSCLSAQKRRLSRKAQILHWVRHLRRFPVRQSEDDGPAAAYPTVFPPD